MPGQPSLEGSLSSETLQSGVFRHQAEHFALLGSPVYDRIDRGSDRFPSVDDGINAALAADGTIDMVEVLFEGEVA